MRYLTGGQASIDRSILSDGTLLGNNLGGPCVFGYTGIRVWCDEVMPLLNAADDFYDLYGKWVKTNRVITEGINIVYDKTHSSDLIYNPDGSYVPTVRDSKVVLQRSFDYGWTNVRTDHIERFASGAKGFYLFVEPTYRCFWRGLHDIKQKNNMPVMWEIGLSITNFDQTERQKILDALRILEPEMASLNYLEAAKFFDTRDLFKIIDGIHDLQLPMFFLRHGEEGSYVLTEGKHYHTPRVDIDHVGGVDPTGCGNSSTAAAMFAWIQTRNPILTGIVANISSGINAQHLGIIPEFSSDLRKKALRHAVKMYDDAIANIPPGELPGIARHGEDAVRLLIS